MVLVLKMAIFPTSFFLRQIRPGKCVLRYFRTKNGFLGNKNINFKKSKNWCFSKGVNPSFLDKNGLCCNFIFQAKQARKMSFTIFQNEKTPFQGVKKDVQKVEKLPFFLKGLTHGFGPKMAIFLTSFFSQNRPGKCVLRYFRTKKRLSRL